METTASITEWAVDTFGPAQACDIVPVRALQEALEFQQAVFTRQSLDEQMDELADVVIVTVQAKKALGLENHPLELLVVEKVGTENLKKMAPAHILYHLQAVVHIAQAAEAEEGGHIPKGQQREVLEHCRTVLQAAATFAAYNGRSLQDAVDSKMGVNRAREWATDGNGVGQHIVEDEFGDEIQG